MVVRSVDAMAFSMDVYWGPSMVATSDRHSVGPMVDDWDDDWVFRMGYAWVFATVVKISTAWHWDDDLVLCWVVYWADWTDDHSDDDWAFYLVSARDVHSESHSNPMVFPLDCHSDDDLVCDSAGPMAIPTEYDSVEPMVYDLVCDWVGYLDDGKVEYWDGYSDGVMADCWDDDWAFYSAYCLVPGSFGTKRQSRQRR